MRDTTTTRWLSDLATGVTESLIVKGTPPPLAAHVQKVIDAEGGEAYHVSLFLGAIEVLGGPLDGTRQQASFRLNLLRLTELFDQVDEITWQNERFSPQEGFGSHVAIAGTFEGRPVRVQVLAAADTRFPAVRIPAARRHAVAGRW